MDGAASGQDSPILGLYAVLALVGSAVACAIVAREQGMRWWIGAIFGLCGVPGWIIFIAVLVIRRRRST